MPDYKTILDDLRAFCVEMKGKNDDMKKGEVPTTIRERCDGYSQAYGCVVYFIDNALSEEHEDKR